MAKRRRIGGLKKGIIDLFASWRTPKRYQLDELTTVEQRLSHIPQALPRGVFLERSGETDKWLKFNCPCGCGRLVALNLMRTQRPSWRVSKEKGDRISVYPSVDSTECGSHYWIKHSEIHWC